MFQIDFWALGIKEDEKCENVLENGKWGETRGRRGKAREVNHTWIGLISIFLRPMARRVRARRRVEVRRGQGAGCSAGFCDGDDGGPKARRGGVKGKGREGGLRGPRPEEKLEKVVDLSHLFK
jgi:hypothetical protein